MGIVVDISQARASRNRRSCIIHAANTATNTPVAQIESVCLDCNVPGNIKAIRATRISGISSGMMAHFECPKCKNWWGVKL